MFALTEEQLNALLAKLGLDPATVDEAAFTARIDALISCEASAATMQTQMTDLQTQLQTVTEDRDRLKAEDDAEALDELNELVAEAGELPDDAKQALITMLQTNRPAGEALLSTMKAKAATTATAQPGAEQKPPTPIHDPGANADPGAMSAEDKVSQANALIKAVQKEGKFKDYSAAREEARRRQPTLFS